MLCRVALAAAAVSAFAVAPAQASGYTFKKLYSLCNKQNCIDGQFPFSQLLDVGGTLYGTAEEGGKYTGSGAVFALRLQSGQYNYSVIYNFCKNNGCPDGATPVGDLIADTAGNLYGTAGRGGAHKKGVVFMLTGNGGNWTYKVLHSFCGENNCTDGAEPATGLSYQGQTEGAAWDKASPLFGTTEAGGTNGTGAVFKLKRSGSQWSYAVIHNVQTGAQENAPLVDSAGDLFITSGGGGAHGEGNLYKLDSGTWHETTIHNFCTEQNCTDGSEPRGRLALDGNGNLFGVTYEGGAANKGVVFEHPAAGGFSVVYDFCSAANCADGAYGTGISFTGNGTFFGATQNGGANDGGVVFRLAPKNGQLKESIIQDFCGQAQCADGYAPNAAPIQDASGKLFGTTVEGGDTGQCPYGGGCGIVYELKP